MAAGSGPPVLSFVLAGVAAVATASYVYLGVDAVRSEDNLRQTCAPRCAPSAVGSVREEAVAANVVFGAAVVALAGAAVAWIAHPRAAPAAKTDEVVRLDVKPLAGGGFGRAGRRLLMGAEACRNARTFGLYVPVSPCSREKVEPQGWCFGGFRAVGRVLREPRRSLHVVAGRAIGRRGRRCKRGSVYGGLGDREARHGLVGFRGGRADAH